MLLEAECKGRGCIIGGKGSVSDRELTSKHVTSVMIEFNRKTWMFGDN